MDGVTRGRPQSRYADAVRVLGVDAAAAPLLAALTRAGIEPIILKGPALAHWLYSGGAPRAYRDIDVLIAPHDLPRAAGVMRELGWVLVSDDAAKGPAVFEPHAQEWHGPDGIGVDLHWRIPGTGIAPADAWLLLDAATEPLRVGGVATRMLSPAARALHVAIHAVQHGGPGTHRSDLERAVELVDADDWRRAAELARSLGAVAPLSLGLRQIPAGAALADRLDLDAADAQWSLMSTRPPAGALPFQRLREADGARAKARSLAGSLFPSAAYVRAGSALAGRGRRGLAAAYALRIGRSLFGIGAARRAVIAARRSKTADPCI